MKWVVIQAEPLQCYGPFDDPVVAGEVAPTLGLTGEVWFAPLQDPLAPHSAFDSHIHSNQTQIGDFIDRSVIE